jgi:hypothetical protein
MPNSARIHHLANVEVSDRDYCIALSVNTQTKTMHIFKHNDKICQYQLFTVEETDQACMWIAQALE